MHEQQIHVRLIAAALMLGACGSGDFSDPSEFRAHEQAAPNTAEPLPDWSVPPAGGERPPCAGGTLPREFRTIAAELVCRHAEACAVGQFCTPADGCASCFDCRIRCVCRGQDVPACQLACDTIREGSPERDARALAGAWQSTCHQLERCAAGSDCEMAGLPTSPLHACPGEVTACIEGYFTAIGCGVPLEIASLVDIPACAGVAGELGLFAE